MQRQAAQLPYRITTVSPRQGVSHVDERLVRAKGGGLARGVSCPVIAIRRDQTDHTNVARGAIVHVFKAAAARTPWSSWSHVSISRSMTARLRLCASCSIPDQSGRRRQQRSAGCFPIRTDCSWYRSSPTQLWPQTSCCHPLGAFPAALLLILSPAAPACRELGRLRRLQEEGHRRPGHRRVPHTPAVRSLPAERSTTSKINSHAHGRSGGRIGTTGPNPHVTSSGA